MKTFLLFDIDGTLLYSGRLDSQCFASSYGSVFGRPFPSIDWTQYPQVTDHVIFNTVFRGHFGRLATAAERQSFEDHYVSQLRDQRQQRPHDFSEVPGAAVLWHYLQQHDHYVPGIATGGWRAAAAVKLAHVGLDPSPPYAAYADGMETREAILQSAITQAENDHNIDRVIYIGDAVWDVTTTRAMALPLIGITHTGSHHRLVRAGAEVVLRDYSDHSAFFRAVTTASLLSARAQGLDSRLES